VYGRSPVNPKSHLDHLALALGQRRQRTTQVLAPQVLGHHLEG
jgi:hypothetical protein